MPSFQRKNGRDHLLLSLWFINNQFWGDTPNDYWPAERQFLMKDMVVGRYLDNNLYASTPLYGTTPMELAYQMKTLHIAPWRCTVSIPGMPAIGKHAPDESFEEWQRRPISFHFRGSHTNGCAFDAAALRNKTLELRGVVPDGLFEDEHAQDHGQYVNELMTSRFCLVLRCDDPHTSRWFEALAAGCIPVIISDGFDLMVAPFASRVNYQSFSISIPEDMWNANPPGSLQFAYNMNEKRLRRLHAGFNRVKPRVLWDHPQSRVALEVVQEAFEGCPL